MMKPLFIYYGNLMRSQMAEGYYNHFTQTKDAASAGVNPWAVHNYQYPEPQVVQLMAEDGIDVSQNRVTLLTPAMADAADKIVVITFKSDMPDYITDSPKTIYWDIDDPWREPIEVIQQAQTEIKGKVRQLIENKSEV